MCTLKWGKIKYYNDGYPDKDEKYGSMHKSTWLIVSSLPGEEKIAKRVINIYKKRMQIEQNFRDLKNQRWGFGLRGSKTQDIERLENLLMIGFISTIVLLLIGIIAETKKLHYGFQANSKKNRRVISLANLGWQIIRQGYILKYQFKIEDGYKLVNSCIASILELFVGIPQCQYTFLFF